MSKRNIGEEIIQGLESAVQYVRGNKENTVTYKVEIPAEIDVRAIRENLHLSRQAFAARFGFSSRTLQHWEQGDRRPHGSAKVLLLLLQRDPYTIEKLLLKKSIKKEEHSGAA